MRDEETLVAQWVERQAGGKSVRWSECVCNAGGMQGVGGKSQ